LRAPLRGLDPRVFVPAKVIEWSNDRSPGGYTQVGLPPKASGLRGARASASLRVKTPLPCGNGGRNAARSSEVSWRRARYQKASTLGLSAAHKAESTR
jgi:hypothetical protein